MEKIYKVSAGLNFSTDVEVYSVGQTVSYGEEKVKINDIVKDIRNENIVRVYVFCPAKIDDISKGGTQRLFKEFINKPLTLSYDHND